jgi:uncharacterized membrane protein
MSNHGGTSDTGFTYAGMAGAVGGLLGVVGIYVGKWFSYGYSASGGHVTFFLNGSEDWTGQVAFIAGLAAFAFGVAYVLLSERQIRTITGALMGVGGIFLLAMSLLAFTRIDEAVGAAPFTPGVLPGVSVAITQSPAGGLWMSVIGGVIAVYGAFLALRRT